MDSFTRGMERDIRNETGSAGATQEIDAVDVLEAVAAAPSEPQPVFVLELAKVSKVLELRLEQMLAKEPPTPPPVAEISIDVEVEEPPQEPVIERKGAESIAPVTFALADAPDSSDADATLRIDPKRAPRKLRWIVASAAVACVGIVAAALVTFGLRGSDSRAGVRLELSRATLAAGVARAFPAPMLTPAGASSVPVVSVHSLPLATPVVGCGQGLVRIGATCQPKDKRR